MKRLRLVTLISGGGRTVLNIAERIAAGELDAEIVQVVSSREGVAGIERAREAGLPVTVVPRKGYLDTASFSEALTAAVLANGPVDLVLLAGFLSLWLIPDELAGKVMNIHPALLPAFGGKGYYGDRVHRAVLESGAKVSGCTVHFADNDYDRGPIIVQRTVPVLDDDTPDTLAARVFEQEKIAYPEAIRLFGEDRLQVRGRRVHIKDG